MNSPAFDTRPARKIGRYDNPDQIIKKIDQAQAEAVQLQKQADTLDAEADEGRRSQRSNDYIVIRRQDAAKLREQARRKIEIRCKFLKEKLAVLSTDMLPFAEPQLQDRSLPKVGSDKFLDRTQAK